MKTQTIKKYSFLLLISLSCHSLLSMRLIPETVNEIANSDVTRAWFFHNNTPKGWAQSVVSTALTQLALAGTINAFSWGGKKAADLASNYLLIGPFQAIKQWYYKRVAYSVFADRFNEEVLPPIGLTPDIRGYLNHIKNPHYYKNRRPADVIIMGVPGVGKTETARFIMSQCAPYMIPLNPGEFYQVYKKGEPKELSEALNKFFNTCSEFGKKLERPVCVYIDEVNRLVETPQSEKEDDEFRHVFLANMLSLLDGANKDRHYFIVGSGNYDANMPTAWMRRFVVKPLLLPAFYERYQLVRRAMALKGGTEKGGRQIALKIAEKTTGWSGSDLTQFVNSLYDNENNAFDENSNDPFKNNIDKLIPKKAAIQNEIKLLTEIQKNKGLTYLNETYKKQLESNAASEFTSIEEGVKVFPKYLMLKENAKQSNEKVKTTSAVNKETPQATDSARKSFFSSLFACFSSKKATPCSINTDTNKYVYRYVVNWASIIDTYCNKPQLVHVTKKDWKNIAQKAQQQLKQITPQEIQKASENYSKPLIIKDISLKDISVALEEDKTTNCSSNGTDCMEPQNNTSSPVNNNTSGRPLVCNIDLTAFVTNQLGEILGAKQPPSGAEGKQEDDQSFNFYTDNNKSVMKRKARTTTTKPLFVSYSNGRGGRLYPKRSRHLQLSNSSNSSTLSSVNQFSNNTSVSIKGE